MARKMTEWVSDTSKSPRSGRRMPAEGKPFQRYRNLGMIAMNPKVIWEMSVTIFTGFTAKIRNILVTSETKYEVNQFSVRGIILFPFIIVLMFTVLAGIPLTRDVASWLVRENRPVELVTFVLLVVGGLQGLRLAYRARQEAESTFVYGFYVIFSIGLLVVGMEEVAWGQWFFGYETLEMFEEINVQKEMTVHNIEGLDSHSEYLRLTFGVAGLVGVSVQKHRYFEKIGAPAILFPNLVVITGLAAFDLYIDYWPIQQHFDAFINYIDEVVEMIIAITALIYIWLNGRMLSAEWIATKTRCD